MGSHMYWFLCPFVFCHPPVVYTVKVLNTTVKSFEQKLSIDSYEWDVEWKNIYFALHEKFFTCKRDPEA